MGKSPNQLPDIHQFKLLVSTINYKNNGKSMSNKEIKVFADSMIDNFGKKNQTKVKDYINKITSMGLKTNTSHTINTYKDIFLTPQIKGAYSPRLVDDMVSTDVKNYLMKGQLSPTDTELTQVFKNMQNTIDEQAKEIKDLKTELKTVLTRNTELKNEVNSLKLQNQKLSSPGHEQKQEVKRSQGQQLD